MSITPWRRLCAAGRAFVASPRSFAAVVSLLLPALSHGANLAQAPVSCDDLAGANAAAIHDARQAAGRGMRDALDEIDRVNFELAHIQYWLQEGERYLGTLASWAGMYWSQEADAIKKRQQALNDTLRVLERQERVASEALKASEQEYAEILRDPTNYPADAIGWYDARINRRRQQLVDIARARTSATQEQKRLRAVDAELRAGTLGVVPIPFLGHKSINEIDADVRKGLQLIDSYRAKHKALLAQIPALKANARGWLKRYYCVKQQAPRPGSNNPPPAAPDNDQRIIIHDTPTSII
ncbi:MAG: hypothetical protein KDG50_02425 [Chromatiales bacterium]|nr:hypothetical protein [Chromatiales bacterium]